MEDSRQEHHEDRVQYSVFVAVDRVVAVDGLGFRVTRESVHVNY